MTSLKAFMRCRSKSYGCLAVRSAVFIKFLPAKAAQCRTTSLLPDYQVVGMRRRREGHDSSGRCPSALLHIREHGRAHPIACGMEVGKGKIHASHTATVPHPCSPCSCVSPSRLTPLFWHQWQGEAPPGRTAASRKVYVGQCSAVSPGTVQGDEAGIA